MDRWPDTQKCVDFMHCSSWARILISQTEPAGPLDLKALLPRSEKGVPQHPSLQPRRGRHLFLPSFKIYFFLLRFKWQLSQIGWTQCTCIHQTLQLRNDTWGCVDNLQLPWQEGGRLSIKLQWQKTRQKTQQWETWRERWHRNSPALQEGGHRWGSTEGRTTSVRCLSA